MIADAIAPDARTWGALIDGPGGIGKTALAVRAGHLAHFERKIFLSAQVREMTTEGERRLQDFMLPNYLALLTELARELGDANLARTPENERDNAVRRTLMDHNALIVIDNLETFKEPERVRLFQFLSRLPQGCKAIVQSAAWRCGCSRHPPRTAGPKDALALLGEVAKTNRHLAAATEREWQTLYEVTGGNPLLLRWTAGQLGRRGSQCRTVADARAYLKDAPPKNDPLEYISAICWIRSARAKQESWQRSLISLNRPPSSGSRTCLLWQSGKQRPRSTIWPTAHCWWATLPVGPFTSRPWPPSSCRINARKP